MEDNENKKAEILAKSKKNGKDEGMENADYRGSKIGVIIYAVIAFFLMIFSIPDRMDIVNTIAALSFAWVVGGTFSHYRFTRDKFYLAYFIASAVAAVAFALMVIIQ